VRCFRVYYLYVPLSFCETVLMINENIADFAYLQSPFFSSLAFFLSLKLLSFLTLILIIYCPASIAKAMALIG